MAAYPAKFRSGLFEEARGWREIEPVEGEEALPEPRIATNSLLDCFYQDNFAGSAHHCYVATMENGRVMALVARPRPAGGLLAMLFRSEGIMQATLPPGVEVSVEHLLQAFDEQLVEKAGLFMRVKGHDAEATLLEVERVSALVDPSKAPTFKIGVLYAKDGQRDERSILSNNDPSEAFLAFLRLLGDNIELKGWTGYRGGLDVCDDGTGTHAVFTRVQDAEVIFHVSTMLPHTGDDDDGQQIQRKRHIGNDVGVIVFVDGTTPYHPECMVSNFTHVVAVVQPGSEPGFYKVATAYKVDVDGFGPQLLAEHRGDPQFVQLLLAQMINGERMARKTAAAFTRMTRMGRQTYLSRLTQLEVVAPPEQPRWWLPVAVGGAVSAFAAIALWK